MATINLDEIYILSPEKMLEMVRENAESCQSVTGGGSFKRVTMKDFSFTPCTDENGLFLNLINWRMIGEIPKIK